LCPLTSAVKVVKNFQIPGTADLIAYLEKNHACLTQLPSLPDDLGSCQVIVVDPFHIKVFELHRLQQFVGAGRGCLKIMSTAPGNRSSACIFRALPEDAVLEGEARLLYTNHTNRKGICLADIFYIYRQYLSPTVQDDDHGKM
jgi:hypothetical protein